MKSIFITCIIFSQYLGILCIERTGCSDQNEVQGRIDTSDRLEKLRTEFKRPPDANPIDAYIVTNYDEHQSQELQARDKRLKYISGFAGKHGVAIITKDKAAIWVHDEDIIQANEIISCEWVLYSLTYPEITFESWIEKNIKSYHHRIGIDPSLMPYNFLSEDIRKKVKFVNMKYNLIDIIWSERPPAPKTEAKTIDKSFTGKTWVEKISEVRKALKDDNCDAMVFTALDEIAWLLNIRAMHVNHLPVVKAYLLLSDSRIELFTDLKKLHSDVNTTLLSNNCFNTNCVRLHDYKTILDEMRTFTQIWRKFCIPQADTYPGANRAIFEAIAPENRIIKLSPILKMKSIKNTNEKIGMKNAHLRDASVFCDIMGYLEDRIKREMWNEEQVANYVDGMRKEQESSTGISYETQVAFGSHSSHKYYITNETTIKIDNTSVFIIDSGGQYLDGTTSVARTFHMGNPTSEQIDVYTKVLKGLIDFSALVFPGSLKVHSTDILARAPLWDAGFDYEHPTGYGIGSHLSAEEGPILIDKKHKSGEIFNDGNFIVVGPSYSKPGDFGIKLKNVLQVIKDPHDIKKGLSTLTEHSLNFETTTLMPFEPKLINMKLLSPQQIIWINKYNTRIRDEVGAQLKRERRMKGFYWMMEKAQNIPDKFLDHTSKSISQLNIQGKTILILITVIVYQLL